MWRIQQRIAKAASRLVSVHQQTRLLSLHEYQSKKLMQDAGITVQRFTVVDKAEDLPKILKEFRRPNEYVLKAQILAGGRGKGVFNNGFKGGVHLTKKQEEVTKLVKSMLGNNLITKQTAQEGVCVRRVMIAEALDIARECYLAVLMDRGAQAPVIIGSSKGGMDIEEVAQTEPDAICKEVIDITTGPTSDQLRRVAKKLGFTEASKTARAAEQIGKLYSLFCKLDATQIEVNPFGETPDGQIVCFDAKINFDDNAAFRQKAVFESGDTSETDPRELEACKWNLNYVGMDGNIGCMVNGAGLAMATMDIIQLHGGKPANFLDVGGGVTEKQVTSAFQLLTSDDQVKAILVNIFGGIVNCATIANGIVAAARTINMRVPVVVRLEGTNVDVARRILAESGLQLQSAGDLDDAAQKAVACLKK